MSNMNGFMAKGRSGGKISSDYSNNCGHPNGSQNTVASPQPKQILNGKVDEKMVQPSAKAKQSR